MRSTKKNIPITKNRGFTLAEMLITLTVAGLVGVLLVSLLSQNSRIFSNQNAKVTDGITLNNSRDKIEEIIKGSAAVVTQYPVAGQAQYTTGSGAVVVSLPSINAQGMVIDAVFDYAVISLDSQNNKLLRLRVFPDATSSRIAQNQVLATNVSKLTFYYYDSSEQIIAPTQSTKIGYIINVNQIVTGTSQSSSASGRINLRNN